MLRPQYTDAWQVAYTYKSQTTLGIGYNRTTDVMARVSDQDNGTRQNRNTVVNLDDLTNINLCIGLRLNVSDVFYSMRFGASNNFAGTDNAFRGQFESRVARATFSYNFGNREIKGNRQRRTGSDEELRRVGGGNN